MKKVALALLVLAIAMPAMADVNITLTYDANIVTIGYLCDGGEAVRGFALGVSVSGGAYVVGSAEPNEDPVTGDYWVYPTNMTFTVSDGNTVVDEHGSPIAEETVNGGVLEMASLYDENDPCHPDAPASSGNLCTFVVDTNCVLGPNFTVGVTLNGQRGGIVLEDPDVIPTVNLPADIVVPCIPDKCLVVGQYCGGVLITQTMYDNWIAMGEPAAWCHPAHYAGDCDQNCSVNAIDVVGGTGQPNLKAAFGGAWPNPPYDPACDTDNNLQINAIDVVGGGIVTCLAPGCGAKPNFGLAVTGQPPLCP